MLALQPNQLRKRAEVVCYVLSLLLIFFYCIVRAAGQSASSADVTSFELALNRGAPPAYDPLASEVQTDFSNWSDARKQAYAALTQAGQVEEPIALLEVNSVQLKVPVYADSSESHLNRGAGVIDGMALPGKGGNLGIAGHRDGFFRALKDVKVGDVVAVRMKERSYRYRVSAVAVVDEHDNSLLHDSFDPTLTLVTCYPFYYQGNAPQRYVVQATFESSYL